MFDHVTLRASARAASEHFYETVLCELGAPGPRPEYHAGYYGAFVLDPDDNNIELVHHGRA